MFEYKFRQFEFIHYLYNNADDDLKVKAEKKFMNIKIKNLID